MRKSAKWKEGGLPFGSRGAAAAAKSPSVPSASCHFRRRDRGGLKIAAIWRSCFSENVYKPGHFARGDANQSLDVNVARTSMTQMLGYSLTVNCLKSAGNCLVDVVCLATVPAVTIHPYSNTRTRWSTSEVVLVAWRNLTSVVFHWWMTTCLVDWKHGDRSDQSISITDALTGMLSAWYWPCNLQVTEIYTIMVVFWFTISLV